MSTTAPRSTRRLTDAQLEEMLALTSHADSVELKLTVPDSERRSTVASLGMDPPDAQIRQVFFFDTPDLALNKAGSSCGSAGFRAAATSPWSSSARSSPASWPSRRGRCVTSRRRDEQGTT